MVYEGVNWNRLEHLRALNILIYLLIKFIVKRHGAILQRCPRAPLNKLTRWFRFGCVWTIVGHRSSTLFSGTYPGKILSVFAADRRLPCARLRSTVEDKDNLVGTVRTSCHLSAGHLGNVGSLRPLTWIRASLSHMRSSSDWGDVPDDGLQDRSCRP